jgi:hypothetical protein
MSLRLGGRSRCGWWSAALQRWHSFSQVGGHGADLRVRVVVRALPLACTTTAGPDPEEGRHGGTDGGPSLRDPGPSAG